MKAKCAARYLIGLTFLIFSIASDVPLNFSSEKSGFRALAETTPPLAVCFATLGSSSERSVFYEETILKGDQRLRAYELTWADPELTPSNYRKSNPLDWEFMEHIESKIPPQGCSVLIISGHHNKWASSFYGASTSNANSFFDMERLAVSREVCAVKNYKGQGTLVPQSFTRLLDHLLETWLFACNTVRPETILKADYKGQPMTVSDVDRTRIIFGNSIHISGYDCKAQTGDNFQDDYRAYFKALRSAETLDKRHYYSNHLNALKAERDQVIASGKKFNPGKSSQDALAARSLGGSSAGCRIKTYAGMRIEAGIGKQALVYCQILKEIAASGRDYWLNPELTNGMPVAPDMLSTVYTNGNLWGRVAPQDWEDNQAYSSQW
ncbi:MAG: hypothetical protein H7222_13565 [Methylotenera sp.]|nr:hypothetical protein [Oligoflexia bacterium]